MSRIEFPKIDFNSPLVETAFELERIRGELGRGTTPPSIFDELHNLFQLLMSIVSARIEGNRTTVYDAVEGLKESRGGEKATSDALQEIANIRAAMAYIDSIDLSGPITHKFLRELHELAVNGLQREGDPTPGRYRVVDVGIGSAAHRPPSHVLLMPEMDEVLNFINREVQTYQQLVHVAIAHHRFLWVHPFRNGNGRVSRLLSYAMLKKHGFVSPVGFRAINPTVVFGSNRLDYYTYLGKADDLSDEGLIEWCTFFMKGMYGDLSRLVSLQDFEFVKTSLIAPALNRFRASGLATSVERDALMRVAELEVAKAGDLADIIAGSPSQRSVVIRSLIERRLLVPVHPGARQYHLSLSANQLTAFVVRQLDHLGFLPSILKESDDES